MTYPLATLGNAPVQPQTVDGITRELAGSIGTAGVAAIILGLLGAGIGFSIFVVYFRRSRIRNRIHSQLQFILEAKESEDLDAADMAEALAGLLGNYADTKIWAWTDAARLEWARDKIRNMADEVGLEIPKRVWLLAGTKAMAYMQRADMGRYGAGAYPGIWLTKKKTAKKKAAKKKAAKKTAKKTAKKSTKKTAKKSRRKGKKAKS